jgi:hypothetical protein
LRGGDDQDLLAEPPLRTSSENDAIMMG